MKKSDIKINSIVGAKSDEEISKPFEGKVEKIYENSVLLSITSYEPEDETNVSDLNGKIVVSFKNLKKLAKKPSKQAETPTNEIKISKIEAKDEQQ
ncbi:DUF2187 domain-containing protein [Lactobacillus iners]|uniref:DUF2187 domain-containing protein n=1 Tax=Lactobacillus iners TaxID=147802 RepID=UPI0013E1799C|nr:DUF2187 domain-containing protein [Lactobacillus iners]MDK7883270.1 DUF2187 domain-containing protein [Lactobacillus iners]QIH24630.1 DUF2187 domain-containing protein [Lactobacillus iners]